MEISRIMNYDGECDGDIISIDPSIILIILSELLSASVLSAYTNN